MTDSYVTCNLPLKLKEVPATCENFTHLWGIFSKIPVNKFKKMNPAYQGTSFDL